MICEKCPTKGFCRDYEYNKEQDKKYCCFAEHEVYDEVCKECDVKELCGLCNGCGIDTVIITEEYMEISFDTAMTRNIDFRNKHILEAQADWQAQEDREIFKEIDEAVTEQTAGFAIRIENES